MSKHRADLIPIELYGANTGNCLRVSIALEEAGIPYVVKLMDLRHGDQRAHKAKGSVKTRRLIATWSPEFLLTVRSL